MQSLQSVGAVIVSLGVGLVACGDTEKLASSDGGPDAGGSLADTALEDDSGPSHADANGTNADAEDGSEDIDGNPTTPTEAGSTACPLASGADECEQCDAIHCCAVQLACVEDDGCGVAEEQYGRCLDRAWANTCYATFSATGPLAKAYVDCLLANCKSACEL